MTTQLAKRKELPPAKTMPSKTTFSQRLLIFVPLKKNDMLECSFNLLKDGGLPPEEQQTLAGDFYWYGKRSPSSVVLFEIMFRVTGVFRLLLPKHRRKIKLPPTRKERIAALKAYELLRSESVTDGIAQYRLALCNISSEHAKQLLIERNAYLGESAGVELAEKLSKTDAREVWDTELFLGSPVWEVIKIRGELWQYIKD